MGRIVQNSLCPPVRNRDKRPGQALNRPAQSLIKIVLSSTITYGSAKVHEPMQRRAEVGDTKDKPATLRRLATTDNERSGQ